MPHPSSPIDRTHRFRSSARALMAGLAAFAAATIAPAQGASTCTAVQPGSICLANCDGTDNGIFLAVPPLVTGLTLGSFQLDFDSANPYKPKVTTTAVVGLSLPAAFSSINLQFTGAGANLAISGPDGVQSVLLSVADYNPRATGSSATSSVTLPLSKDNGDTLGVVNGNTAAFGNFLKAVTLQSGDFKIRLQGYADTRATASGDGSSVDLCLRYVELDQTAALQGLGGLTDAKVSKPSVKGGSPTNGIELSVPLTINSPSSNIFLNSNTDAIFNLVYQNGVVGTVRVPNLSIKPGVNSFVGQAFVNPDKNDAAAVAATSALLTAFTGKQAAQVTATGGRSSNMPSLDTAFSAVSLSLSLPPNTQDLIVSASFKFPNLLTLTANANLVAFNPFEAPASITYVKGTLTYSGQTIGTIDTAVSGFTLPAGGQATSPSLTLHLKLDIASIKALLVTLGGKSIPVDVTSSLTIDFGGYSTSLSYNQNGVPTVLDL
ncbi:hypothetical protein DFJ73DRAFT_849264 [Zopfochytrium polystomum]|nr:hypothetical protein DFJ73DRAFT_849264 [Zopfochytrium polystomum]